MPMFHSAPILLEIGSVVLPGNYGRILRATGPSHKLWHRETILERVRATRYSGKPSRWDSCFICVTLDAAKCYRDKQSPRSIIYEVEKVDPHAIEHRSDFNVVEPLPGRPENMEQIAELYWRAALWTDVVEWPGVRCEEMVTVSALRIVGRE